jgi:hypothetical protein
MKSLIKIIADKIKDLFQDNRKDFRIIPFGLVLIYMLILLVSEFYLGSYAVIGKHFRIHPIPYFVDLKILLCGIDAIRESADPYNAICVNGVPYFNYPYIWGFLSFIPFITMSNLIYIGLGLALTLFSTLYFYIGKINFFGAIVYTLLFVSPAIMLGVERANCDLIIFLLLLIPLFHNKSNSLFAFVILITSLLKLFPIGAIICILNNVNNRIKKYFWLFVSVILIFLMYLILMKENIILVSQKTPRPYGGISYGLGEIPSMFIDYFKNYPYLEFSIFIVFIVLFLLAFIIFYNYAHKNIKTPLVDSDSKGISYLIGAGIFITTCLIGYNWEYSLIFLLLTIPQILSWISENKIIAIGLLFFSILIVWQSFIVPQLSVAISRNYSQLISQLFVILLFYGHLSILLNFLNSYYKKLSQLNLFLKKS